MKTKLLFFTPAVAILMASCEPVSDVEFSSVELDRLAGIISQLPLQPEHIREVHSAVSSSIENGYDEEYTMADLFTSPGSGVGSGHDVLKSDSGKWSNPLRDLLTEGIRASFSSVKTKSSVDPAEEYIRMLTASDAQIYWPYSEDWDGVTAPLITFDPGTDAISNKAYFRDEDGTVREVTVTEEMAMKRPVWVINRNDDSMYMSLELYRKEHPEWGQGGVINIHPQAVSAKSDFKSLIMKDFCMQRNYDTWLAGASEFFVKCGGIEGFTASTEAEMKLYMPSITDFMVVVRRYQRGEKIPFNAVLISDWTEQLDDVVFVITEDDGGTQTSWKCTSTVKVNSKSYGFDINIPFNTRDDIVWRGKLSRRYFENNTGTTGNFGDVKVTFEII